MAKRLGEQDFLSKPVFHARDLFLTASFFKNRFFQQVRRLNRVIEAVHKPFPKSSISKPLISAFVGVPKEN